MTNEIKKGGNTLISASDIQVKLSWNAPSGYDLDVSAFMLNDKGIVKDDESMVFYNQTLSNDKSVSYDDNLFNVKLNRVSDDIHKIVFTVTIDGGIEKNQKFSSLGFLKIAIEDSVFELSGSELQDETALMFGELYRHNGQWKFKAVGQGFNGGLAALCKHFGLAVEEPAAQAAPAPVSKRISLEKKLAETPKIFDLSKKAKISLEKVKLTNHKAKVCLCLDISGSMGGLYSSGKIQELMNRILALGCQLDDDGQIDVFLFGSGAYQAGEVGLDNFSNFANDMLRIHPLEGSTNYGKVMKLIRNFYFPANTGSNKTITTSDAPVYVMFVTDGATGDKSVTEQQLIEASYEPIFWQFMAIGKSNGKKGGFFSSAIASDFDFLEKLDDLKGRFIDNADFFSVEDPVKVGETEMYDLLMTEYPGWLKTAKSKNLLK